MSQFRDQVGLILRAPVVGVLAVLWIVNIWPLFCAWSLLWLVGQPVLYPFAYAFEWLKYAFLGKEGQVLPEYWKNYPDEFFDLMKTGFPTLRKWLLEGFED